MARESTLPQQLMTGSLLHFEQGVPIDDLDLRREHKERLVRVQHVYWQWMRNPMLDVFELFKQLVRNGEKQYADRQSEWRAAQKDKWLFDFVVEHVAVSSRRQDEMKVRAAAEQSIRIGMETDNVVALTKGGKLLYDVAHLGQPESEQADLSKAMFIPPVVTTVASEIDPTKEDLSDEQARLIMNKYNAYVDDKRKSVDDKVEVMMARRGTEEAAEQPQPAEKTVTSGYLREVRENKPLTVIHLEEESDEQDRQ